MRASGFRRWLAWRFHREHGSAPNSHALTDAAAVLEGIALFDGAEMAVHTRIAELDGVIYVDLADANWKTIAVAPDGWRLELEPPVRFRRARGMLPLPIPERGGSLGGSVRS